MSYIDRALARPWFRIAFGIVMFVFGILASVLDLTASALAHFAIGVYFFVSGMATLER